METKQEKPFIGCTQCYRKKKDCKCTFGDFHRINEHRYNYWKFELVDNSCGKEIRTSRTDRNDALHCGDVSYDEVMLCDKCSENNEGNEE